MNLKARHEECEREIDVWTGLNAYFSIQCHGNVIPNNFSQRLK